MESGQLRLPGKNKLGRWFDQPAVVVVDVSEMPLQRLPRYQRWFDSGKKRLPLKYQVIEQSTGRTHVHFVRHRTTACFQAGLSLVVGCIPSANRKFCRLKALRECRNCTPFVCPNRNLEAGTSLPKTSTIGDLPRSVWGNRSIVACTSASWRSGDRNWQCRFGLRSNLIAALYNYEQSHS